MIVNLIDGTYELFRHFYGLRRFARVKGSASRGVDRPYGAAGENDEIHDDEHGVVAPAVCSRFAPEASVPGENLFPDRSQHDEDQPDGSELSKNPKRHPQPSGELTRA